MTVVLDGVSVESASDSELRGIKAQDQEIFHKSDAYAHFCSELMQSLTYVAENKY